jgi:SAM-dependent methyltransferase
MLAVARGSVPAGVDIEWYEAKADAVPLPDSDFDVVLCQLGSQFFPDRPAALRQLRRVLAAGGRVAANVCGPTPPVFGVFEEALRAHLTAEAASFVDVVFSLDDAHVLHDLLADSGFVDVTVETRSKLLRLPPPAEFLWQYVWSTPLAAALATVEHESRVALERDVVSGWDQFTHDGALIVEVNVLTATARRS